MEILKPGDVFTKELLKNIHKEANKVAIKNNKNEIIKYVPIYYLMIFDYFNAILERWLGTATEKCITLDETFDTNKTKYFVKIIESPLYPDKKIINNNQDALYFFEIADKYSMKSYLVQNVLKESKWIANWKLLINIAKSYENCIMGSYMELLFKKVFNYISKSKSILELKTIPCEGFQLDTIRQLIIDYYKSDNLDIYGEEILLDKLSNVVIQYNLSVEIFSELLSIIRWFYISKDTFTKLKAKHSEFIIPEEQEKIILSKINKRTELIKNCKQNYDLPIGSFWQLIKNSKKNSIESFYYTEDLGDLDARSKGKYVREFNLKDFVIKNDIMIRICTTKAKFDFVNFKIHHSHRDQKFIFSICQMGHVVNIIMNIYTKSKDTEWNPIFQSTAINIKLNTLSDFQFSLPNSNITFIKFVFHAIWVD